MNIHLPNISQGVENPDSSPKICVRIQTKQRGNCCTVSNVHLQLNTELTNSSLFLNVIKFNPKASLGVNGGTIPPQKLVSDKKKKYTLC